MTYQAGFPIQGERPPYAAPGVPTPYTAHIHPYPTRYHGGIWTRPVFCKPYVQSVQSVFKPTDFWECNGCKAQAGLGALSVQTHRGVFGEQVRGGGVFGEELRGLGKEYEAPTFMPMISTTVSEKEQQTTAPALKSPDARVKELQGYLSRVLTTAGYKALSQDGKLGPGTCGAIAWYRKTGRALASGTTKTRIEENLAYVGPLYDKACASKTPWKAPSKAGVSLPSVPAPTSTPAVTTLPARSRGPSALAIGAGIAAVAAVGGGAYWLIRRKG